MHCKASKHSLGADKLSNAAEKGQMSTLICEKMGVLYIFHAISRGMRHMSFPMAAPIPISLASLSRNCMQACVIDYTPNLLWYDFLPNNLHTIR